jgi:hypothetical protein
MPVDIISADQLSKITAGIKTGEKDKPKPRSRNRRCQTGRRRRR